MSVRKYNLKRSIKKVGIIFENDYYFDESFIVELIENLSIKRKNIYLILVKIFLNLTILLDLKKVILHF